MNDTTDTVLVIGATGKVGRRVVPRLRLRGFTVRAASRSAPTRFDWSDPAGWAAPLHGVDALYVVPPAVATVPGPVHDLMARAAEAGVRRVVLQSGHGADRWGDTEFGRDMLAAEDAVRSSTLEWSVLRPSNFFQNFDEELLHDPLRAGRLTLPAGTVPEPFVDVEDVADVAATVLDEPGRHAGRTYELTGPRALTFAEAVAVIARASGRSMTYEQITPADYTAELVGRGVGEDDARVVTAMYEMMARGVIAGTSGDVAAVLGREPRGVEEYALRGAATQVWGRAAA